MSKKILFITPPFHVGVVEVAGRWVPLTYVYLAGAVRTEGFEAEIYDAMSMDVGFPEIEAKIRSASPDFVAVSSITCTTPDAVRIIELAKSIDPSITTIMGGVHPTFMYGELMENHQSLDYVVIGEGDVTLPELLKTLKAGGDLSHVKGIAYRNESEIVKTPPRELLQNIDSLPVAWDLVEWKYYRYFVIPDSILASVSTSRGCNSECTFCSQQKFWHKIWRGRSPEDVVEEIELLNSKYGVNVILFPDEYPTADRKRWERLLDLLIAKKLGVMFLMETRAADIVRDADILDKYKKAGIIHVYVGLEGVDQNALDYIKKGSSVWESRESLRLLKEHGLISETSFILGLPDDTEDSIAKTLEVAIEFDPDFAHFLAIAPWPYADLYEGMKEYIVETDYRKYNLIDPVLKPKNMSVEEIDKAIIDCYRSYYMNKFAEMTLQETDIFKKKYMVTSMKLMMSNSFIQKKIGAVGEMPEEVKKIIEAKD